MNGRDRDLSRRLEVVTIEVQGTDGPRLDHYLGTSITWRSRTGIQDLIHSGKVLVNGERTKPSRRVRGGDIITIEVSPSAPSPDYDALDLEVLYEDPWLLAINKPPGLLVHPVGRHIYDTLINYLHHRYQDLRSERGEPFRPRLCHRIDKETTGVVVVGKEPWVHNEVRHQFENRRVEKEYIALALGAYPGDEEIDIPIGEGFDLPSSLEHPVLRRARTGVRVLSRPGGYSLLSCVPHTGRQNQIRIHVAARGHAIVGDERYDGGSPPPGFPARYLLHSRAIRLRHPRLKSPMELTAPLPPDFSALVARLESGTGA